MTAPSSHRIPTWLLLVGAMTALGPISIDMYLPGFPAIEREFAQRGVEATMAAYMMGIALGQLVYGPVSDRVGRKPPLYVGFVLYVIGSLGCAFATSLPMLTVMRVVQALGGCAGLVIGRAIVRDRSEVHEAARAFSTLTMIVALGPIIAPAAGGLVVTAFGWRATFIFQAAVAIVLVFAMHHVLRESMNAAPTAPFTMGTVARSYLGLLRQRSFVAYSLLAGFGMGALFSYVAGAPIVLTQRYGLSAQQFGWLIALNGIAFMVAGRLNMRSLHKLQPREVLARFIYLPLLLGVALLGAAYLPATPLWLVVGLQLSFFVSVGRIMPNVSALALAPHGREAGAASALLGSLQSLVSTAGGAAVAIFNDGTVATLATLMTAGALGCVICFWVTRSGATRATSDS